MTDANHSNDPNHSHDPSYPNDPNHTNDSGQTNHVNRFRTLPNVLIGVDGEQVTSVSDWEHKRRPEIIELFREYVYGREPGAVPRGQPGAVRAESTSTARPFECEFAVLSEESIGTDRVPALSSSAGPNPSADYAVTRKQVRITFKGPRGAGHLNLLLFIPPHAKDRPVPLFLLINNREPEIAPPDLSANSPFWPAQTILSRGYATAVFQVSDLDPDHDDHFQNGVHALFDAADKPRPNDAWGTIAAWAWGASRVMDYLERDVEIDEGRVAVVGHSRGGKTALWAGALDERFTMVVSNDSGCTGAAITRGKKGETVRDINRVFPHWFAKNYRAFDDHEDELPVDQHMLLAAIAPRLLYVASASDDEWADPDSEFSSLLHAEPVYQLYGFRGLSSHQFPEPNAHVDGDAIRYHLRQGGHDLNEYDWNQFMDFADGRL